MSTSKEDLVSFYNDLAAHSAQNAEKLMSLRSKLDSLIAGWPVTPPPPPVPAANRIRFGVHQYDNKNPVDFSQGDVFDLQRGFRPAIPPGKEGYIFTNMLRRPGDKDGLTQFLPPAQVVDPMCVHLPNGALLGRIRESGYENLVNFSNPLWQSRAITKILQECRSANANLYLDEVDNIPDWAWSALDGEGSKEFPTDESWRSGLLQFVSVLASALHQDGRKLWVNLGASYQLQDPWQRQLLSVVDGVNIEFFVGREGVGQPVLMSPDWERMPEFLSEAESLGVPIHVRCSSTNQSTVDFAFCTWLAGTMLKGSFSASTNYAGSIQLPSASLRTLANQLGQPTGKYQNSLHGYYRQFERGVVRVNPFRTQRGSLLPSTGAIVLT